MNEWGGYLEAEYSNVDLGIHRDAIHLNTGRNCLEYILLVRKYTKIYIPYYTCDAVLEPLERHNVNYEFYRINDLFEPSTLPSLADSEAFLYTNYFGLKGEFINSLTKRYSKNLIIDNSQALFDYPVGKIDTFYSLRKFVGVSNGAFLYTSERLPREPDQFLSFDNVVHLYKRKDKDAAFGFLDYKQSEASLSGLPILKMAPSTKSFVSSYDFEKTKVKRERNFLFLHSKLYHYNTLAIDELSLSGPYCYPLLLDGRDIRASLIEQNIYIPLLWPNVLRWADESLSEFHLAKNILALPVDQRYEIHDLAKMITIILSHIL